MWNKIKDVTITYNHEVFTPTVPIVQQKTFISSYGPVKVRYEGKSQNGPGFIRCVFSDSTRVPKLSNISLSFVDEDGFPVVNLPIKTIENFADAETETTPTTLAK